MKGWKIFRIGIIFMIVAAFTSCEYEFIEPPQPDFNGEDSVLSFSDKILPIFTDGDNCTSCHNSGGTPPDLTAGNAYNSIMNNNLVDTAAPEQSVLYDYVRPDTDSHDWKAYTSTEAQLVLEWIKQGAKNN
ncbi:MAG: hypothetical protein K9I94_00650 [Bacteroidales bacterium]|nr:hypothetical protein [Bacteroidales bacterium]